MFDSDSRYYLTKYKIELILILEIQLFCFGTMLALGIVYMFHLFLFCPVLIISDKWVSKTEKSDSDELALYEKVPVSESPMIRRLTNLLAQPWFVCGTLLILMVYWFLFGYNMLQIVPRLDASKILPKNSRIQRPNALLHDYSKFCEKENVKKINFSVWREYQAVNVIVDKPFRIENEEDKIWLNELVGEFESLPRCLGKI